MRNRAKESVLELVRAAHKERRLCVPQTAAQSRQLSRGVGAGILIRPYRGVYDTPDHWQQLTPEKRTLFSARALGILHPTWVFAGTTAALIHGLCVSWSCLNNLCVAVSRTSRTRSRGGIHRIVATNDTPVERSGLRVTSFLRTICDCLRTMPFCDALALVDSALRERLIQRDRLLTNLAAQCHHIPGFERVQAIAALADGRSESGGESIARAQMLSLGFVAPELQRLIVDPIDPTKTYRADFAWDLADGSMVLGELDGHEKYRNAEMTHGREIDQVLLAERRREAHLTLAGGSVRVMRFSLAEAKDSHGFECLLTAYGVPRRPAHLDLAI